MSGEAFGNARGVDSCTCVDPQTGEPFRLMDWQRRFLARFDESAVTVAALSLPRGAGKSTFAAFLAARALMDPANRNATIGVLASSFQQGGIVFGQLRAMLGIPPGKSPGWKCAEHGGWMYAKRTDTGAQVRVYPADSRRLHGAICKMFILDEPAVWGVRDRDAALAVCRTSLGKVPGGKLVAIGTASDDPDHWWHGWTNGAEPAGALVVNHRAPPDADIRDPATWRAANPSLVRFPTLEAAYRAEVAALTPATEPAFRALRLNMGGTGASASLVVDRASWDGCLRDAPRDGWFAVGFDLGSSGSWSAAAAFWPSSGRLEAFGLVPGDPDAAALEKRDGARPGRYAAWLRSGELVAAAGRAVTPRELVAEAERRWGRPLTTSADHFRRAELEDELRARGWPKPFVAGAPARSADLAAFRDAVSSGALAVVGDAGWWRSQVMAARTVVAGGHERMAVSTEGGRAARARDDGLCAAIRAVSRGFAVSRVRSDGPAFAWAVA